MFYGWCFNRTLSIHPLAVLSLNNHLNMNSYNKKKNTKQKMEFVNRKLNLLS